MKKKVIICLLLSWFACIAVSQNMTDYNAVWQTKPSFGYTLPLTKLLKGNVTDYLLEYDDMTVYWQVISLTCFFHRHWGISFNYQANSSGNISKRAGRFLEYQHTTYGSDYYVIPSTGAIYDEFSIIGGDVERGYLGLIYRIEKKRFLFYPELAIGVVSFYADWGKAILKEKNSNTVLELSYWPRERPNDHFAMAASTTIGYKLSNRFYLNADFSVSRYKTDIMYAKTTSDLGTGEQFSETIGYQQQIYNLCVGAGLIIVIK
jgi:hypothetical protein